jgi:hypothetical protein
MRWKNDGRNICLDDDCRIVPYDNRFSWTYDLKMRWKNDDIGSKLR